jgi:hypothetical protein
LANDWRTATDGPGRAAVVRQLGDAVGPQAGSPDPELTGYVLSAVADAGARLLLDDPERYPPERLRALASFRRLDKMI